MPEPGESGRDRVATCVTAPVLGASPNMLNPLTRAAQVATYDAASQSTVAGLPRKYSK
jgi:hypothetical protein